MKSYDPRQPQLRIPRKVVTRAARTCAPPTTASAIVQLRGSLADAEFDAAKKIYFWPFDDDMRLREVRLGPLAPHEELEPVRLLVKQSGLDAAVSRARLGFGAFEVRPDGRYPPL